MINIRKHLNERTIMLDEQKTTLDLINGLSEIAEYMEDEEFTVALTTIAKLILKPDIPIMSLH